MVTKLSLKRAALGAATGVVALGAVVAVSSPASASIGNGRIQLCAQGNYAADLAWHDANNTSALHSYVVNKGSCQTFNIPSWATSITVGGYYNTSGSYFSIYTIQQGSTPFSQEGIAGAAQGVTTARQWCQWQPYSFCSYVTG